MTRNRIGLKCIDVSTEFEKCFYPWQKEVFVYKQGEISITIADQFNLYYGDNYLTYNKDLTMKYICQVIKENEWLINDIKYSKAKIEAIKNPDKYKDLYYTEGLNKSSNDTAGSSNTNANSTGSSMSASTGSGETEIVSMAVDRSANTQTSQVNLKLEKFDKNLKIDTKLKIKRKRLDLSKVADQSTDVWVDDEDSERQLPDKHDEYEDPKYNQVGFTANQSSNKNASLSNTESVGYNKTTSLTNTEYSGNVKSETTNKAKAVKWIEADNNIRALNMNIPNLRKQFWIKFNFLFKGTFPCND